MSDSKRRNRRIILGILVGLAVLGLAAPQFTGMLSALGLYNSSKNNSPVPITTTTTKPVLAIKPLPVRPVISAFVTKPELCPAAEPGPPDQPLRICDIAKTAVYELGPEGMRLQPTDVDSFLNPLTGLQLVQVTMTAESAQEFAAFTATQVGKQVAFVRGGTVAYAPKISGPIDGQVLQLSGELTAEQAKEIAGMLGEKR